MNIITYKNISPRISKEAFIAESADIMGKVEIKDDANVWYNCTLRGDVNSICIGKRTNIQDGTVIHVDHNKDGNTIIGDDVTVGHKCLLHACILEDKSFVGMGSIVMDGAIVKSNAMLAAGSMLTKNKVIPSEELWAGSPATFFRKLKDDELEHIVESAKFYTSLSKDYI